jgi:hypothetical protein
VRLPTIEDAVKARGFLAGRPEDIIEQLKAVEKALSRPRPRHLRHRARHPARGQAGRPRPLREGSNPRLPRHPNRRRRAVAPTVSRRTSYLRTSS